MTTIQHLVVFKKQESTILVQLKRIKNDEVVEQLEVPGTSPEAYTRAFKLGEKLLEQNKKSH